MYRTSLRWLTQWPGFRTRKKWVVFESDDWGSIRIPSGEAYHSMLRRGMKLDSHNFTMYDSLEQPSDVDALMNLLFSFKDVAGKSPVFTLLCLTANPDFQQIKSNDYAKYIYEPVIQTYLKYDGNDLAYRKILDGISNETFAVEWHGREHLQILRWMQGLKNKLPETMFAASLGCTGVNANMVKETRKDYQAAFDPDHVNDLDFFEQVISSSIQQFKDLYGNAPRYFVPPNGLFPTALYPYLFEQGIRWIASGKKQQIPTGNGEYENQYRYLGKKHQSGLQFIVRNAFFEPSEPSVSDWVGKCLQDMQIAFAANKPVVISTHRVNYISRINQSNQQRGLALLRELLEAMLKKWPDIEFLSSTELGEKMLAKS